VTTSAIGATLATTVGLAVLLSVRRSVSQTTLMSAWWWVLAGLIGWASVELWSGVFGTTVGPLQRLRFAAVVLSLCPAISVIGAKRPQHAAWNLVVLALWMITALPAAEAFFLQRGGGIKIGDVRSAFLWGLILLGLVSYLPTRYWLAALLLFTGQIIALAPHLIFIRRAIAPQPEFVGLLLAVFAIVVAWFASRRRSTTENNYDAAWRDFRDAFGLFWALRVQERMNAAAKQFSWDLELDWRGFRRASDGAWISEIDPNSEPALRSTFKGLLRRFVTNGWIDQRLH
jgi:hypothetical protein